MPHRPAVFQIDAIESYFHGVTQDQHWNGFACPLFSLEETQRLMALNNHTEFCGQIVYDAEQDAFLFHEFGVESEERPDVFKAVVIDGEKFTRSAHFRGAGRTSAPTAKLSSPPNWCAN